MIFYCLVEFFKVLDSIWTLLQLTNVNKIYLSFKVELKLNKKKKKSTDTFMYTQTSNCENLHGSLREELLP